MPQQSKTARASMRPVQGSAGGFVPSPDVPVFVPLGADDWCYVRSARGTTEHVRTSSPRFVDLALERVAGGSGSRVAAELEALAATGGHWVAAAAAVNAALAAPDPA